MRRITPGVTFFTTLPTQSAKKKRGKWEEGKEGRTSRMKRRGEEGIEDGGCEGGKGGRERRRNASARPGILNGSIWLSSSFVPLTRKGSAMLCNASAMYRREKSTYLTRYAIPGLGRVYRVTPDAPSAGLSVYRLTVYTARSRCFCVTLHIRGPSPSPPVPPAPSLDY